MAKPLRKQHQQRQQHHATCMGCLDPDIEHQYQILPIFHRPHTCAAQALANLCKAAAAAASQAMPQRHNRGQPRGKAAQWVEQQEQRQQVSKKPRSLVADMWTLAAHINATFNSPRQPAQQLFFEHTFAQLSSTTFIFEIECLHRDKGGHASHGLLVLEGAVGAQIRWLKK